MPKAVPYVSTEIDLDVWINHKPRYFVASFTTLYQVLDWGIPKEQIVFVKDDLENLYDRLNK